MNLLSLPHEIVIQILTHVFPPWSATMSITCQLTPIPNIQVLRTNNFFCTEGTKLLMSSFTSEFIRYDRRGCIVDQNLEPKEWYSWIMRHTKILHFHDAYFTIWYIPGYWECYPALEGFRVTVLREQTYNDPAVEMPDFEERRRRCDERTKRFAEADYSFHPYLFDEMLVVIYKDMERQGRSLWPTVEYCFYDCGCHRERQTVFALRRTTVPEEVEDFIDESFTALAYHVEANSRKLLHQATVNCVALPNEHGFAKSLGTIGVSLKLPPRTTSDV